MWKRLRAYLIRTDALLEQDTGKVCWEDYIRGHLCQIGFFQHERAVHLAITLSFGLYAVLCLLAAGILGNALLYLLLLLLLVLIIPYTVHYFHLENGVQRLYIQYDCMLERISREGRRPPPQGGR